MPKYMLAALVGLMILGCAPEGQKSPTKGNDTDAEHYSPSAPITPREALPAAIPGFGASIITPKTDDVASKVIPIDRFTRTLEDTKLTLTFVMGGVSGKTTVELLGGGRVLDSVDVTAGPDGLAGGQLKFKTPKLTSEDRQKGYADVIYDVHAVIAGQDFYNSIIFKAYDKSVPSFVQERTQPDCIVKLPPEIATGCIPNDSATVRILTRAFSITKNHEVDVQFSGGISIPISIVTISLGGQVTKIDGTQVQDSISLQDTEGIFCAGQYFKQIEERHRVVDIFAVQVDGSLRWRGEAFVKTSGIGYKFVSTPSESHILSCDGLFHQLPVGPSAGCAALGSRPQ